MVEEFGLRSILGEMSHAPRLVLDNEIDGLVDRTAAQPFEVFAGVFGLTVGVEIMGVALEIGRLHVAVFAGWRRRAR